VRRFSGLYTATAASAKERLEKDREIDPESIFEPITL
jgi:hypothetical protein